MAAQELINTPLFTDPSITAYYRLEDATATIGSNLTNNGSTTFSAAKFNNGANGGSANSTKCLTIDSNSPVGISQAQAKTAWAISCWFNPTTLNASDQDLTGFQATDGTNKINFYIRIFGTTNNLGVSLYDGTGNTYNSSSSVTTATWYQCVMQYTGTNLEIWLNGSRILNQVRLLGNSGLTAVGGFGILCNRQGAANFDLFSGLMDDVAVFTRILTSVEISNLFNGFPSSGFNIALV